MDLKSFLSQNPKKYLIFDLDGTIAKLHMDWSTFRRDIWDLVASFDKPLTVEIPYGPKTSFRLTNEAIRRHGTKAKNIIDTFIQAYELSHLSSYTINPELARFIKTEKQYNYFLWSNQMPKTIEELLQKEGLKDRFQKIMTRASVDFVKPDPQGFDFIYNPKEEKKDYLMIGDLFADEQAATSAGIDFFLVNYFKK